MTDGAREKQETPSAADFLAILRLCVAIGLTIVLASAVSVAVVLLPEAVSNTAARVWIGIGLFGVVVAGLAAIGVYSMHAVGEEKLWRWLRGAFLTNSESERPDPTDHERPVPGE